MKRFSEVFLLIMCMAFFLSCGKAVDRDNLFEMSEEELETTGAEGNTAGTGVEIEQNTEYNSENKPLIYSYAYGNMQKNVPPGNFADYQDSIIFYYYNGQQIRLYTINKETLEVSPFCKDATCNHKSTKCASLGVGSNLEAYGGSIYALNNSFEIVEMKEDRFVQILKGQCSSFWHANNSLYVCTRDGSLIEYPDGQLKDFRIISDEYTNFWNVIFSNKLYGSNSINGVNSLDLTAGVYESRNIVSLDGPGMTDGINIYYFDIDNFMYCCDMDGTNSRKLYDTPVMFSSMNFDEDYIYFRYLDGGLLGDRCNEVYRASKNDLSHPELFAEIPGYVGAVYVVPNYEKLFIEGNENFMNPGSDIYTVNKDGSGLVRLEIPEF